ncbi:translocon-associated protein subunit delta-like [Patella vulgata]|uniref:translocon-associated protein subunit delta-like n=1 Tax=Patella vulgata TaxID=6465 RepID=UPI0024A7D6AE|nr:translocon-associated protein subunit delta-like [Patella vulgata]
MAATTSKMLTILVLAVLTVFTSADVCLGPVVRSETYTTSETTVSTETVFISQFTLTCKNGLQNINLFADVAGRMIPAVRTTVTNQYQITITDEYKALRSGNYEARFYDEEGFSALKKARRNNEDVSAITPLFTITISHGGVWQGTYIQSEFVAACVAILVWWLAFSTKSKLTP